MVKRIVFVRKQYVDLNQMSLFLAIIEQGSFTAAATTLGISKGQVSKKLSALEEELGVTLLTRTTRTQHLTSEGERFLDYCRSVVRTADEAWTHLQTKGNRVSGPLRISAPITYGQIFLPALVSEYSRRFPEVEVDLVLDNRITELSTENFDVAVRITDFPPHNYSLTPLGVMEDIVCAAPNVLRQYTAPSTPSDLASFPCLLYLNPGRLNRWSFTLDRKVEVVEVNGPTAFNHHHALLDSLLAGHGVAKLPEYCAREYLQDGRLIRLLPNYRCGGVPIYLVHQAPSRMPPRVREWVRFMKQSLQGDR